MKEARSTLDQSNLQEFLDAEVSSKNALNTGQAQYFTPSWLVDQCHARMVREVPAYARPATAIDIQAGNGALVDTVGSFSYATQRFAVEMDERCSPKSRTIHANCVRFAEALDDIYPGTRFVVANANPPFGKKFKLPDGGAMDSTEWTWQWVTEHANCGFFICNHTTAEKLGINTHPWVFHYETHGNAFKGVDITIGIAFWKHPQHATIGCTHDMPKRFNEIRSVLIEERTKRPDFNIYLDDAGYLRTYLSIRDRTKRKLATEEIERVHRVNKCHPLALTTEKETRDLMAALIEEGIYTIQPQARAAIESALAEVAKQACPIMPVTDFESVAYADEEETLTCLHDFDQMGMHFTAGKKYAVATGTYNFIERFARDKMHFNEASQKMYKAAHDCTLSGQDRFISIKDDFGTVQKFMDRPTANHPQEHSDSVLWQIFQRPVVLTVAEVLPEMIEQNLHVLRSCELMAGFSYFTGQLPYLARVGAKDSAIVGADMGCGKTLFALSLISMKGPRRCLIIAPQGTMRSSKDMDLDDEEAEEYAASQWLKEITRFAPYLQVFELFSLDDYNRLLALNNGELPSGVYVTYYQAFFQNGARESKCESWDDKKFQAQCRAILDCDVTELPPHTVDEDYGWSYSVGKEVEGIRCIMQPCLSTLIGKHFDMVLLDEAHLCANLGANVTQMLIRLQPQHKFALTGTPIPNIVSNLFSLAGWLCVTDWYRGGRRNAAWPYARDEQGRFDSTFLSTERDLTAEEEKKANDPKWKGKCEKTSPIIASPARLLKLLKPFMAYIGKPDCNPKYVPPKVIDVRVPLGLEQAKLYEFYMNRANIPCGNALVRARKQTAYLRNICADPAGFSHGTAKTPKVASNMNPKTVAALRLIRDILERGEQVTVICARVGQSKTLVDRLTEAGIPVSRIDSTVPPEQHAYQANLFKSRKTWVNCMGIKCAASHSFDQCPNEIILSIEYSPGPFNQAKGRVDRVTSEREKNIWCILHQNSIEETQFDVTATKGDAATICVRGQRVPRDFRPVDASEILAKSFDNFDITGATPETDCETEWPKLREALRAAYARVALTR